MMRVYEFYHRPHYNVNLEGISVGGVTLQLPTKTFNSGANQGTIIDSGTTLAYLPESVYKTLMAAVGKHLNQSLLSRTICAHHDVFFYHCRYLTSIKIYPSIIIKTFSVSSFLEGISDNSSLHKGIISLHDLF